jgi:hypothetical protein
MTITRRSIVSAAFFMILGHAVLAQNPDAAGHWEGMVTADLGEIHFALDLSRRQDGGWIGTYSQPAQGLVGLPLTVVAIDGRSVRLVLGTGARESVFTGEVLADGTSMIGQAEAAIGRAPFTVARTGEARIEPLPRNEAVGNELEGRWAGTLDVAGRQLRLVLTIANQPDGTAAATIASLDEGLMLPVLVTQSARSVTVEVKVTGASYTGLLNADGSELAGTFARGPVLAPLTFRRSDR